MRRALVVLVCLAAAALFAGPPSAAAPGGGSLVYSGYGFYPRVIRLAHNGSANGTVIAAVVTNQGGWVGAIFRSTDNGRSYTQIGAVNDPANAGGMCCQTLYELPTAIGNLPAGTLLWAASFGADAGANRRMSVRISASTDQGAHWSVLSTVVTSPGTAGLWEPELTVSADGHLVAYYSDETDPAHSQKLVEARSTDALTWTDFTDVVAPLAYSARPGMAVVRPLPTGGYLMSYEVCSTDGSHNCEVYVRDSPDDWSWGDPTQLGNRVLTADGRYPASTPTISVAGNTVLLTAMRLRNADGTFAAGDGATVLGNTQGGQGSWFDIASPVPLSDPGAAAPAGVACAGYSSPLLGSADGKSFLELATDVTNGTCLAYAGSAAALPTGSTGGTWAPEASQAFLTPNQQHYSGVQPNGTLRHWWWDSGTGFARDDWATGATGYPVAFVDGTQQHVFARTPAGTLEHYFWDAANGGSYHDTWATSGVAGDPAAMLIGSAQHVWWVDTAGNLQHSWWDPADGGHHDTWGSGVVGRPSVMVVGGVQHVFARTTSGAIAHWWWDGWQPTQRETFAGGATGDPAVVEVGDAQHVWFTDGAGNLHHWWWAPAGGWANDVWGTGVTGRPTALLDGDQQDVWARGTGGTIEHFAWSPSTGNVHDTWGGRIAGDPTSLLIGDAQHVWALDATGTLQHWWWNPVQGLQSGSWGG